MAPIGAAALAAVLGAATWTAAARGLAGLNAWAAERALHADGAGTRALAPAMVDYAEARLRDALRLGGDQPEFMDELAATLALRRRLVARSHDRVPLALTAEILRLYRRETVLRPTWPYAWAALARAKRRAHQTDAELEHALMRASATGPWEPGPQLAVLEIGLDAWHALSARTHAMLRATARRTARIRPEATRALLARFERPDLLGG